MISYDDGERFINTDMVFYLTLRMDTHNRNPNDNKNNAILKQFIATFINSLEENDQQLLNKVFDNLSFKPERRYKIGEIKKLYNTL